MSNDFSLNIADDVDETDYDQDAFDAALAVTKEHLFPDDADDFDTFAFFISMRQALEDHDVPDDKRSDLVADAFKTTVSDELHGSADDLKQIDWTV